MAIFLEFQMYYVLLPKKNIFWLALHLSLRNRTTFLCPVIFCYYQKEGSNRCISPVDFGKNRLLLFHHTTLQGISYRLTHLCMPTDTTHKPPEWDYFLLGNNILEVCSCTVQWHLLNCLSRFPGVL